MLKEFSKNTQRFAVKTNLEKNSPDEAIIKFKNRNEVEAFFKDVMRHKINKKIAKNITDTYCHSAGPGFLEALFSNIDSNKLNISLKKQHIKRKSKNY